MDKITDRKALRMWSQTALLIEPILACYDVPKELTRYGNVWNANMFSPLECREYKEARKIVAQFLHAWADGMAEAVSASCHENDKE